MKTRQAKLEDNPLWYKDAIFYEVRVRSFCDSDQDGVGDFKGLAQKLDYIQDLGVTTIWLLPFYPSPLKDDGYDISDYTNVHPDCGNLQDFRLFLREAHARGLRVVTELVLNHTSDQHPWFKQARTSPNHLRDYYVWSDTPEKFKDARIIFKDFEHANWTWDPVAKGYFWHRFYSHQPDLNYENPEVRKAMFKILDFWLEMGVDGLRLDAVPYLFEREGTNCENLAETHAFLKELRRYVDQKYKDRMFLAEANQWPEDAVAYFGNGDECQMAFHFPIMPRLFMAIHMEDSFPVIDILAQTPAVPDNCQWALFLRNHDELTLEMVTDEERDYMYRVYAHEPQARINLGIRRRLAPLLGNHRRKIELMKGLLFALPGTPVIYYGDEIGMGDNIYLGDRNGVRTPMQWSADRNAGFSRANPQRLYLPIIIDPEYHYEANNVEAQQNNPHSLLWWMKRLIALRKRYKAFSRGSIHFIYHKNPKVLVFTRTYEDERVLVVANLSRFVQYIELDLKKFKGSIPIEMFGQVKFPPIGDLPYFLTLGPHTFYWFALEPEKAPTTLSSGAPRAVEPLLETSGAWTTILERRQALEAALPAYLSSQRWFAGKAKTIRSVKIEDTITLSGKERGGVILLARVEYAEGNPDLYTLPLVFLSGEKAASVRRSSPHIVLCRLQSKGKEQGILCDGLIDRDFCWALFETISEEKIFEGGAGELGGQLISKIPDMKASAQRSAEPSVMKGEQSNTSVSFGSKFILKIIRRIDTGPNPEVEIGSFLTARAGFTYIPPVFGVLEYRRGKSEPASVAVLEGYVRNQGDAWRYTLDQVVRYLERVQTNQAGRVAPGTAPSTTPAW